MPASIVEIFWRFLVLGCFSFGGPAAHIGYFQKLFVEQLNWLDSKKFGDLLSLSQFLPGPGSSQLGFAIGMNRAGLIGGIAAFVGFTLPSFFLLYLLAINVTSDISWLNGVIHALKLLAVVVVADACISMFASFCKTKVTQLLAVLTAIVMLVAPSLMMQVALLALVAITGAIFLTPKEISNTTVNESSNKQSTLVFTLVLFSLPFLLMLLAPLFGLKLSTEVTLFNQFYQAGSLVFGGGHVVLPLLQQSVGEALTSDQFLMGYASAQAIPGPMFTLATFLGANLTPESALTGAIIATLAIFLPGFLLLIALHSVWQQLAQKPAIAGAIAAVNAAVVGLLLCALFNPVFSSGVSSTIDMAIVFFGFFLLRSIKISILSLVGYFVVCGLVLF